jgi:hypothetical protein
MSNDIAISERRFTSQSDWSRSHRWLSFLMPSVSDLIFIVLLIALSCGALSTRLLGDAGIGWHIRNGQQILQTHTITRTDAFSSTMSGQAWYAWEWLYDGGIALIHGWLGLDGVVLFTALIIATTFALVFRLAMQRGGVVPPTIILLVLAMGAAAIHYLARPHVLSWLFAVIWFQRLEEGEAARGGDRKIFWMPLTMLLWVNLHGGFLTGFVLLGLYIAGAFIECLITANENQKWLRQLAVVTGFSLLASLVNPFGYKLYMHVYQYLSNRFLMNHIDEFRSPDFHGVAEQCFAVLVLIAVVSLVLSREKPRPSQVLVILFAIWSGMYASRNLPVSSILLVLVVAPILARDVAAMAANQSLAPWLRSFTRQCQSFTSRMGNMESKLRGHLWPAATLILGLLVCMNGGRLGATQLMNAHFDGKRFPVGAAEVVAQRGLSGPVFCPDIWGGYLIYRLYPATKVMVDDRHDLYGEAFFKDYLKVIRVEPGWDEILNQYQVGVVLVPTDSPLAAALGRTPQWTVTYKDATATLFARGS